jgi:hypothetical protein
MNKGMYNKLYTLSKFLYTTPVSDGDGVVSGSPVLWLSQTSMGCPQRSDSYR